MRYSEGQFSINAQFIHGGSSTSQLVNIDDNPVESEGLTESTNHYI